MNNPATTTSRPTAGLRPDGLPRDAPEIPFGGPSSVGVVGGAVLEAVAFMSVMTFGLLLLAGIATAFFPASEVTSGAALPGATVQLLSIVIAYLVVVLVMERRHRIFELSPERIGGLVVGLLGGAAALGASYLLITLLGGYRLSVIKDPDIGRVLVQSFAAGVGAGVGEELMFRGILFRLLEHVAGTWGATFGSGLVFGLMHVTNPDGTKWGAIAIVLEAGFLFGILYALTRNLWLLIGFHAAWNVVQGPVLGVPISGTGTGPSVLRTTMHGSELVTGGTFGTEASIVSVGLMMLLTIVLMVELVRRGGAVRPVWARPAAGGTAPDRI